MTTPSIAQQQVTQLLGVIDSGLIPRARETLGLQSVHSRFLRLEDFDRKTAQLSETRRESG